MSAIRAYIWTDPDMDGIQFCATHGCGEIVTVRDCATYAELATENKRSGARVGHYSTAAQARRAGEDYLRVKGVRP